MPNLPTFTVTQATADRLLAAFAGQQDDQGNPMTPVQAYKDWLKGSLIEFVARAESHDSRTALRAELQ